MWGFQGQRGLRGIQGGPETPRSLESIRSSIHHPPSITVLQIVACRPSSRTQVAEGPWRSFLFLGGRYHANTHGKHLYSACSGYQVHQYLATHFILTAIYVVYIIILILHISKLNLREVQWFAYSHKSYTGNTTQIIWVFFSFLVISPSMPYSEPWDHAWLWENWDLFSLVRKSFAQVASFDLRPSNSGPWALNMKILACTYYLPQCLAQRLAHSSCSVSGESTPDQFIVVLQCNSS